MEEGAGDEERLIEAAAGGDDEAFRGLVRLHQNDIYDLCLRVLGSPQDAEDIAQDTFVGLHRNLWRYERGRKLRNWLYTMALNRCRSLLRRRKIVRFFSLEAPLAGGEEGDGPGREYASKEAEPDFGLERAEAEAWTRRFVESLPETLREAFVLRHLKGMAVGEIAGALGLSVANVKVRLHRAKLNLWKKFGNKLGR